MQLLIFFGILLLIHYSADGVEISCSSTGLSDTDNNISPPEENNSSNVIVTVISVVISAIDLMILVTAVVFVITRKKDSGARKLWMNKELAKECNRSKSYTDSAQLSETTETVMKSENVATTFLFEKVASRNDDTDAEAKGKTAAISTCNDPSVQCLKVTQVDTVQPSKGPKMQLNMNKLDDFYMTPLYIGQVPVKNKFESFWQAVDEFDIVIVVWLDCGSHSAEEFHISIKQMFIPEKHGAYSVRNMNVLSFSKEFKTYELDYLRAGRFVEAKAKKLYVLENTTWPCLSDQSVEPPKLIQIIKTVDAYNQKISKSHQQSQPKSVLIHCPNGVEQSATFATIYVGRQMWLSESEISPVGIMRYIRKCRHGAFTKCGSPGKQLQFIFSTLLYFVQNKSRQTSSSSRTDELKEVKSNQSGISKTMKQPCKSSKSSKV